MSKNRKFEKQLKKENEIVNVVEETIEEPVVEETIEQTIEEPVIEETIEEISEEVVEKSIEEEIEEIKLEVTGIVSDCKLLNVRSKPEANAEVVTILSVDSTVIVCDVNASQDFYKVLVGDLEGFCMKKFIKIKE